MQMSSLDIKGYKGLPVPNTFYAQEKTPARLGILLPGYRFSADRAELYYAGRLLLDHRADLLRLETTYYLSDYPRLSDREQDKWLSEDALAACETVFSQRGYSRIVLIGKSLGTIAMGHLLGDSRFAQATCIWFTPVLTDERLVKRIEQLKPRSLFIIGTADHYYKPEVLQGLVAVTRGCLTLIDGMNHGLEVPGGVPKALELLNRITDDVRQFLEGDDVRQR